jgi:Fe-S cluster assembly protein SufD
VNAAELPNRRVEAWKYSDLRAALSGAEEKLAALDPPKGLSPILALAKSLATGETTRRFIVGEDGDFWTSALREDTGGVTTVVAPVGSSGVIFERLTSWADQNTKTGFKLSAACTDIVVEDHAKLIRILIQDSSDQYDAASIVQLSEANVRVGAGASFRQFVFAEGARLARIETHVSAEGEGAEIELNGVYLVSAGRHADPASAGPGRHADLTSTIEHKSPNGQTRQLIKGAARKGGRGVFQGKIVVAPGAQKTDARQYHHGMLLEEGAEIFAKPELMIHADDVQCAHGNTAGGLDERALFYMRARGVPEAEARALLIEAFLTEAVPDWTPDECREEILTRIRTWLGAAS